jgi:hypothetical protein
MGSKAGSRGPTRKRDRGGYPRLGQTSYSLPTIKVELLFGPALVATRRLRPLWRRGVVYEGKIFVAHSWPKRRSDDWLNQAKGGHREGERCLQMRRYAGFVLARRRAGLGLSRRRSRVRVPPLPSRKVPAIRHIDETFTLPVRSSSRAKRPRRSPSFGFTAAPTHPLAPLSADEGAHRQAARRQGRPGRPCPPARRGDLAHANPQPTLRSGGRHRPLAA